MGTSGLCIFSLSDIRYNAGKSPIKACKKDSPSYIFVDSTDHEIPELAKAVVDPSSTSFLHHRLRRLKQRNQEKKGK